MSAYNTLEQAINAAFAIAFDRLVHGHGPYTFYVEQGDGAGVIGYSSNYAAYVSIGGAACDEETPFYEILNVATRTRGAGDDPTSPDYFFRIGTLTHP